MSEAYTLMHIPVRLVEAVQGVVSGVTVTLTPAEAAVLASLRAGTHVCVPRKLLTEARACMRATGWHLAPASECEGDGVLHLAVAEVEDQFGELIAAAPEVARDGE